MNTDFFAASASPTRRISASVSPLKNGNSSLGIASPSNSLAKGESSHHLSPRTPAWALTISSSRYALAPKSMGRIFPAAALSQAASRNSLLVAKRSAARVRIRSGSTSKTVASAGMRSRSSTKLSTNAGAKASIPSIAIPRLNFSNISENSGWSLSKSDARFRTLSVSANSRHGGATCTSRVESIERWSATLKYRTSSMLSPQNSIRIGCS